MPRLLSILHVDLDAFFAAAEEAMNPSLRGKPVIVGGRKGGRGVVAAASYTAREYGVHSAMPITKAERLCPEGIFIPCNFGLYRQFSSGFFAILSRYTPLVEGAGLDEAYLDITGCGGLVGDAATAAADIQRRVQEELGLSCSIGVAGAKVVAKVASDQAKPAGIRVVPRGEEAPFLAPLPVRRLPMVGPRLEQTLKDLAVATIGDLARLPQSYLMGRFGATGSVLWLRANGIDTTPVEAEPAPAKSLGRETTFAADASDRRFLEATLRLLVERTGADLRRLGLRARKVTMKVRFSDFVTVGRGLTLAHPSNADEVLFQAGNGLLRQVAPNETRPVRLIGLRLSDLTGINQLSLWESETHSEDMLAGAVDRVRNKYGMQSLQTGRTFFQPSLPQFLTSALMERSGPG